MKWIMEALENGSEVFWLVNYAGQFSVMEDVFEWLLIWGPGVTKKNLDEHFIHIFIWIRNHSDQNLFSIMGMGSNLKIEQTSILRPPPIFYDFFLILKIVEITNCKSKFNCGS